MLPGSPAPPRPSALLGPLALLATLAGLFAAGVLSLGHLLDLPVPCGGSRGCSAVAAHPASRLFGVPIAYGGVAAYGGILLLLLRAPSARWARLVLLGLTGLGTLASAGLLHYSQTAIGATCRWCVASGAAMALLFVVTSALVLRGMALPPFRPALVGGGALLVSIALGVQAGWMERAASAPPIPAARLAGLTAADLVDPAKTLGPKDAPVTIVVLADLLCPACRAAHASLVAYQARHPRGVRLAFRHLPLWDIRGHETSGAAAALAEIAAERGRFWDYVHELYRRPSLPDRAAYLDLMDGLGMDGAELEARIADAEDPAVARVWRDVALAERLGITSTPTFIVLIGDAPPVSANLRTLPLLLSSPAVLAPLLEAAR